MARHRSFKQDTPKVIAPITFDLGGTYYEKNPAWPGPETDDNHHGIPEDISTDWSETFTCKPMIPAATTMDLRGSMVPDESGVRVWHQGTIFEYFPTVLIPEDVDRFNAVIHDPKKVVQIEVLVEIYQYLNEEYSNLPS